MTVGANEEDVLGSVLEGHDESEECSKSFSQAGDQKNHMRTHHGEVVSVQMREDEEEQENPFGSSKLP